MTDHPLLAQIRDGWKGYNDKLIWALSPLSNEQLAFRITPELRNMMTNAAHIVAARVFWFHLVLKEGPSEIESLVTWDDEGEPFRTSQELVAGLEKTWAVIEAGLNRWTAVDMGEEFPWPREGKSRSFSRKWVIWHVLEHDLHHGGEISLALGANGIEAIDV